MIPSLVVAYHRGMGYIKPMALGSSFGKWTVIGPANGKNSSGEALYLCRCECGREKPVSGCKLRQGHSKSCARCKPIFIRGEKSINWKGGRTQHPSGYWHIRDPAHPNADKRGYVFEHVYIMSKHIGRAIRKPECVHHKNGKRDDNRISNLELWYRKDPSGQRVTDKIEWAVEFLRQYAPEKLK